MSEILLSRDSIITILESLEETRDRVIKEGKGELPTDCSREDLIAYLDQIETAIDELEALYNRLRASRPELAPFSELKRQR
ncbi:MAG: hypothetical protein QM790_01610 [Nibricoccus sp.]